METILNPSDVCQAVVSIGHEHTNPNSAGSVGSSVKPASHSRGNRIEELVTSAEGALPSVVSDGLQGGALHAVFPPTGFHVPSTSGLAMPHPSPPGPNVAIEETVKAIESPSCSQMVVGDVTNTSEIGAVEEIENTAQVLVLSRLRTTIFAFVSKLPVVGSYFVDTGNTGESSVDALATETTPLLGALRDPKAFATEQAEGLLRRVLSPLLRWLPDIDALDNVDSANCGTLFKVCVECYVLGWDGGGWLFTHLQEHSLVIAPTISLGHLSTTDLAASTIGTAVASVTGYSIIQGFISSLDKVLANAPNHQISKIACAQAAVVTGVFLFPITHLWTVQSASILQRLGQSPEVAVPASKFLQVTAAGLPGYAIGEIAKRYLTSQGLSNVHTWILSVTAPLNLLLNYILVDGPIPALRLGFAGAPLCTVLSHNVLAITLIVYIVLRAMREEVNYLRGQNDAPDEAVHANDTGRSTGSRYAHEISQAQSDVTFFTGLGSLVFAGVFGISKSASQLWSKDFGGVVASMLGPDALATQAVLLTTATTLYQAPKAMGSVTSHRVEKWMTKGDIQRAKIAASVGFVCTLGGVIVISNVLLAFATSWGTLFNNDPVILQNVSLLLPIIAIFQAFHGIGAWADSSLGALSKAALFPSINASADYFLGIHLSFYRCIKELNEIACAAARVLVGIPLGVYLALQRKWGLAGLWVGLTVSLAYACLVATVVLVRTNWNTAAFERCENAEQGEVEPATEHRGNDNNISV